MLDDSLRRRLEALNRERLPSTATTAQTRPKKRAANATPLQSVTSCQLLTRGVVVSNDCGEHLAIRIPIDEFWPQASQLIERRCSVLKLPESAVSEEWQALVDALPAHTVAFDLETCGLGGAALFLVGLLRSIDGKICVELLLARNYAEEAAVLWTMWATLAESHVALSFNGKSFDWPMIVDRSRRWLLDRHRELPSPTHIDLLHPARRRWRKVLPDCRLLTLEQHICRRSRRGDIDGRDIPAAYDEFVRTGEPAHIEPVLYHNALDVVTLFDLALRMID